MIRNKFGVVIVFALLSLLGCETTANSISKAAEKKQLPRVKISYDHTTHTCTVSVSYMGKTATEVYSDDAYEPDNFRENVMIRVNEDSLSRVDVANYSQNALAENTTGTESEKRFAYHVFGFCRQEGAVGKSQAEIWIDMWLPSSTLRHDGNLINSGLTTEELAQEGFSITFPPLPSLASFSSKPNIFEEGQVRLGPTYISAPALYEADTENAWYCIYGEEMRIIGGTFTVLPDTKTHPQVEDVSVSRPLGQYNLILDQWEFDGVLSLSDC